MQNLVVIPLSIDKLEKGRATQGVDRRRGDLETRRLFDWTRWCILGCANDVACQGLARGLSLSFKRRECVAVPLWMSGLGWARVGKLGIQPQLAPGDEDGGEGGATSFLGGCNY